MSDEMSANTPETIFVGNSEMARLMRSYDWSQTSLSVVETWPQSLRSTLGICLNSRFPIAIYWGAEHSLLYNDAWRPIVGDKHPWSLGRPAQEVWSEIWDDIGAELASVLATGEGTFHKDTLLSMYRFGYTEECFFEYTFNPIQGQAGVVEGVFNVVTETTYRVLNERRAQLLRNIAAKTGVAKTAEESCSLMLEAFRSDPLDIPFALLYLIDQDGTYAHLCGSTEVIPDSTISPASIDLTAAHDLDNWLIARAVQTGQSQTITDLPTRFGVLPGSPWPEPPQEAMVVPFSVTSQGKVTGVLIAVASPRRRLDESYCDFFNQVAGQIALAIANARAYEEERQRAEALAELDRAKTTFFSNISHEFRTPLTLMLNPLEDTLASLEEGEYGRVGEHPSTLKEQLEIVYRNSQRLLKLVNTLLDFSRIEAGRIQAVYEPTDLAMLTADLAGVFRSAIERAGMRLQVDCPPLPEPVYVDREMWEKIVLNLLSNAFKFTFEGEIAVSLHAVNDQVELEVRDTGTGIPAEELPHIFERFHRVKGARGRSYEGSGIGLALVQELVKLHSGTIRVSSGVDQGTCFTVAIPMGCAHLPSARLQRGEAERIGATRTLASTATGATPYVEEVLRWSAQLNSSSEALAPDLPLPLPAQPKLSAATARILLANDNADMRDYLRRLLGQQYQVETVADGVAALTAIRQQRPDLVLTDVMMPEMGGFELLRSLRADPTTQDIPIILLSARAGEEARIEGLAAGADDYLTKPFSARELLARVEANLKLAQLRQEATQREQALRLEAEAAQQKVEMVLASISDGVYTLDRNWCFTYVNDRVCEIAGMPREDLLGFNVWDVFPEAVETDAYPQLHRAMGEQVAVQFEYFHSPKNCWIENRGYPSPEGVTVFLADISDRKRIEAERKQAEAEIQQLNQQLSHRVTELQTLFDLLPVGVAIALDPECRMIRVNPYLSELTRVPIDANASQSAPLEERPIYRLCREGAEIPVENLPMQYAAIHNTEVKDEVLDLVHPDGTVVKLLCYCSPLLDERGNVRGVLGAFVDITQRVAIETALRRSETILNAFIASSPVGMAFFDRNWRYVYANDALAAINGIPLNEHLGRTLREVLPDWASTVEPILQQVMETKTPLLNQEVVGATNPADQIRHCLVNYFPVCLPDGEAIGVGVTDLDITARKQAEEDLRLNRDRLAFVLDNTGIGLWLNSLPLNNLNWDNRTREFFFVPPDVEPTVELFWSRLHPDDREPTRLAIEASLRDRTLYQIDHRAVNPDTGEIRWIRSAGKAIYAPDGTPIRFDGINYDISDRKQAEEALRRSEERLRVSQELSLDAFTILDSLRDETGAIVDFVWTYVNPKAAEILKHPVEELVGQRLLEVLPGNELNSELFERYVRVVETGEPHDIELSYNADGITGWFRNMAVKLEDGVAIFFSDITERKQTELALREAEERLRVALQNAPITVFNQDHELKYTWIHNPVLHDLHEMLGKHDRDYLPPEDAEPLTAIKQQVLETGIGAREEIKITREGTNYYYDLTVEPLRDENNQIIGITCAAIDVSELKQSEINLRESEARFRGVVESNMVGILFWDASGCITDGNEMAMQMLGYSREELQSGQVRWIDITPPEFHEIDAAMQAQLLAEGVCPPFEKAYIRKDGTQVPILIGGALLPGYHDRGVAYFLDITERKQAEQERERLLQQEQTLRQQAEIAERRLYALLESIREDFVLFDRDWRVVYLNSQAATTMRKSRDQILGRCHWDLFPDLVGTEFYDRLHQAMREQTPVQFEYYYDTWGTWFENRVYPTYEGITILCTNITDRKQAEAALRQSEAIAQQQVAEIAAIYATAPVGLCFLDLNQRFVRLNQQMADMTGLPVAEHLGRNVWEIVPDLREAVEPLYQQVVESRLPILNQEVRGTAPALPGVERTWLSSYYPLIDSAGQVLGVNIMMQDISDRVQSERDRERILQQAQAAREAAEAANRIKDEFLAVVSHELRAPLNPIVGWAKLLRSGQLDAHKSERAIEVIERNAQMQSQLINDLLDISRILRGKLSLDPKPVDLVATIQAAMETVRLAAEAKAIQIHTQLAPDVGAVSGDAGRLQQVVWNLLSNAVKFTPEGGRVEVRLEGEGGDAAREPRRTRGEGEAGSASPSSPYARITITDTGKGIAPDFLPYVFDHFRQESSATTRRFGGLGLGLAIVRYLVELHGGTVQADSAGEGQGATFTVRLPLMPHQLAAGSNINAAEPSLNLQGTRILVVDDDANTREFLAVLLELHGANVIATATASEALTTLTQFQPDILLSDIGMPDVDGYMLVRQIRTLPPEQGGTIPAIALTAYAGEIDYQQAMAAGFQQHLAKPIDPQALIQTITSLIKPKQTEGNPD
ncbi:MAG: PAS domain-containing protein [Elainella sp. C42_A2020_010]|nr:PAS domain-containing protein [Elainella sp. C42_A2020_010]